MVMSGFISSTLFKCSKYSLLFSPFLAKTGILKYFTKAAATSSCVERGLEAQRPIIAPDSFRAIIKLAVSAVTCKQAPMVAFLNGFDFLKLKAILESTGISFFAHSILISPFFAKLIFLMLYFISSVILFTV